MRERAKNFGVAYYTNFIGVGSAESSKQGSQRQLPQGQKQEKGRP